ncbi:hypothetical protein [Kitasatospora sp. NBC_01302]|uniref:hypothetical protein n=1 Tax=Kitasatospora sp. NBC_01302 TaxID=2903575 RepID=UPI002E160252|nr:hypothetical protein OG294_13945 [Kitasatospora sp. NBC_01302]
MNDTIKPVPDGLNEIDLGMSNFDHSIDPGFEDRLRNESVWGRHAAWNFNGRVWFADGEFHEEVWRYGQPVASFSEATLTELMETVSDEYGWE